MRIDYDDDVFLGAETLVVLPVEHAAGAQDEDWGMDEPEEAQLSLHETIGTLLRLHRD
jgi:hypothetical protein